MSKISTLYDTLLTEISTLFPSKTRIPYPESLADNNYNLLTTGYGLIIGDGSFFEHEFCNFAMRRTVKVVFTYESMRLDSDTAVKDDKAKKLLEDCYEIEKLFYNYSELGIPDTILKVDIVGESANEVVLAGKSKYVFREATFDFLVNESF